MDTILSKTYPAFKQVPLTSFEVALVEKETGERLTIELNTTYGEPIKRQAIATKIVSGEVFHKVKRKGRFYWVKEFQTIK